MKKIVALVFVIVLLFTMAGCNIGKKPIEELKIVRTFPATTDPDYVPSQTGEETIMVRHYEMSDGTWKTDEYSYKYRLEVSGRMNNAAGESTYIILSNRPEISFDEAWKASGFSSNMDDYFDPKEAVIVGSIFRSDQKASELQAEFSRDFSVTDDLLYRGESLDIRKLNPCSDENVEK